MTAYDTAVTDLNTLANPGSYGWTPQTPTSTIINAYNDFLSQVQQFSAADQATMQNTEEWITLQVHGPTGSAYDPTLTQSSAAYLSTLVASLGQAPAASPPANSGGFNPGGGTAAAGGGGGSVTPQPITASAAATAAAGGASPPQSNTLPSGSSQAIMPVKNTASPAAAAATAAQPASIVVAPKPGVSIPAAVFIGLGALLLGGVLVFMFQPEMLGMQKNPIKKKRRKKRKS